MALPSSSKLSSCSCLGLILRVDHITPTMLGSIKCCSSPMFINSSPPTTNMKTVILCCLAAFAAAAPQQFDQRVEPLVNILHSEHVDNGDGSFRYAFSADNGLETEVVGTPGASGQSNMQGFYLLPLDNGQFARVEFIANEGGFQPQSDVLPQGPALPEHVHELLRIADEQIAQGIQFDDQGFRL